jgi:hypothetical protein
MVCHTSLFNSPICGFTFANLVKRMDIKYLLVF